MDAQAIKRRLGVAARVVTKCGMRRDGGAWMADGRARTIMEDASTLLTRSGRTRSPMPIPTEFLKTSLASWARITTW